MKLQRLKLTQVNNVELRQEEMKHLIQMRMPIGMQVILSLVVAIKYVEIGVIILIGIVISDWRIKHLRIH